MSPASPECRDLPPTEEECRALQPDFEIIDHGTHLTARWKGGRIGLTVLGTNDLARRKLIADAFYLLEAQSIIESVRPSEPE